MCDAIVLLNNTILSIQSIRLKLYNIDNLIESSKKTAQLFSVYPESDFTCRHRTRKLSKKIDENSDSCLNVGLLTFYRKQFNQILDSLISLSNRNLKVFMKGIHQVIHFNQFLQYDKLH